MESRDVTRTRVSMQSKGHGGSRVLRKARCKEGEIQIRQSKHVSWLKPSRKHEKEGSKNAARYLIDAGGR